VQGVRRSIPYRRAITDGETQGEEHMSREAMQLALEALELYQSRMSVQRFDEAVKALRQALETEQEPVAWRYKYPDGVWRFSNGERVNGSDPIKSQPLYTAPPKKQWVGLTDEERHSIREWQEIQKELGPVWAPMMLYLYLAIEAKLKEKNHG
jgi:hypothetical protein